MSCVDTAESSFRVTVLTLTLWHGLSENAKRGAWALGSAAALCKNKDAFLPTMVDALLAPAMPVIKWAEHERWGPTSSQF